MVEPISPFPRVIMVTALAVFLSACRPLTPMTELDTLFSSYSRPDSPGAAVLVTLGDRILLERCYGLADVGHKTPVTPETNFRLASVTKQFTATAVLQLVEAGRLTLETTMADVFPEFPMYGRSITTRLLLSHTSGLLDYEDLLPDTLTGQILDAQIVEILAGVDSTYFPPGTAYRYSNSGYAVLAMMVEQRSGERFADYLKNHIFTPAGMKRSVAFEDGRSVVPNRAFGYRPTPDGFVFADQSPTSAVLGDGGIYSSVRDLARWNQVLYSDVLLRPETLELAFTPATSTDREGVGYGFGWRIDRFAGQRRLSHTGSTSGFRNVIQRYPDRRLTIVILSNRSEPEVADLADRLAEWALLRQ